MPCATIHLLLAERVLKDWEASPASAPVPVRFPEVRHAFLHGALAPDIGFIPGTDRFLSELAHYHSPADLSRALLRRARGMVDEAFAWGWATHVLGDVEIHPVVGRSVGELLHGDRERRVDAAEDVSAHVSLEVGLDILFLELAPETPLPPATLHASGSGIELLRSAIHDVYGLRWHAGQLKRDHRQAVRLTRWWPRAIRALGLAPPILAGGVPPGSAVRGFLRPIRPPAWVVREVSEVTEGFAERFRAVVESGMQSVENRNLETGGLAGAGLGHAASDAVERRLEAIRESAAERPRTVRFHRSKSGHDR